MKVERTWAMPNHRTFQIPPITQLLQEEHVDGLLIEPFPFQSSVDCFEYLAKFQTGTADYALIDPPLQ
jgi:hypothetical protein